MRPLRILHTEAATSYGGQERFVHQVLRLLRARGHDVEGACQPDAELAQRLRADGFTVHTLLMDGPRNYLHGVARLRRLMRDRAFDVVNSHSRRDTVIAAMAARLAGVPVIVRTRHLARPPGSLWSYTRLPRYVIAPSEFVRGGLLARGAPADRVAVVHPPVAWPEAVAPAGLRRTLGLSPQALLVVCVAVFRGSKGHHVLLDAMAPLFDQRPDLHLLLVGDGEPLFSELAARVLRDGVADRVHLLGRRDDVPAILADSDVFALATESEAAGMVFVEAAAAGLPVVGTAVDGVPEMLSEGQTGLLVPPRDPVALREALRRLLDDAGLRERMGAAGRRFYETGGQFAPAQVGARLESCYQRWLESAR